MRRGQTALDLLKADHAEAKLLFRQFEKVKMNRDIGGMQQIAQTACVALRVHARIEDARSDESSEGSRIEAVKNPKQMQSRLRPPFSKQHLRVPGLGSELDPLPRLPAQDYRAAAKLERKVALAGGIWQ